MRLTYNWNQYDKKTDTEWYFKVDENGKCIICFNGSEPLRDSVKDWFFNLAFWRSLKKDYSVCGIKNPIINKNSFFVAHWGLSRKWEAIKRKIIIEIAVNKSLIKSYEISGYSQGASTAIFCHRWLKATGETLPIKTVVAGALKVFGLLGLKRNRELCKDVICLQNGNDIVTKLVPWYFSVGTIIQKGERTPFKFSEKDHLFLNYKNMLKELESGGRI
jgi:hypothetical protein